MQTKLLKMKLFIKIYIHTTISLKTEKGGK
jgi:hypothetical protein